MFAIAAAIVLFYGIRGYFVDAIVRIGFSVYQVLAVLSCIAFVTVIDILLGRGAQSLGAIQWGRMPPRSQYALFVLAVTFTWLMGLMGFARSGVRQYWHVWQVVQDTSKYAATPALGRSEEHTSELQSRLHLVCRLLLEKKKKRKIREVIDKDYNEQTRTNQS